MQWTICETLVHTLHYKKYAWTASQWYAFIWSNHSRLDCPQGRTLDISLREASYACPIIWLVRSELLSKSHNSYDERHLPQSNFFAYVTFGKYCGVTKWPKNTLKTAQQRTSSGICVVMFALQLAHSAIYSTQISLCWWYGVRCTT